MDAAIHIGNNGPTKEVVEELGVAIQGVMRTGYETHMEQKTIRRAIAVLDNLCGQSCDINGTQISNSNFTMNPKSEDKKGE